MAEPISIVITGASGFVGRHFLEHIRDHYTVFAIARRSAREAGVQDHPNIHWIQWDIANRQHMSAVLAKISREGGADFLFHLAAFYDFNYTDDISYQRTNIDGTRNVIDLARELKVKRFLFASSLAASRFPEKGKQISEKSPVDADFAYERTKRAGEEMVL